MRKIEMIAVQNGLSSDESNRFYDLFRAFVLEMDNNPTDPYFTPEIIIPMLLWLTQHCRFMASTDAIAIEFNSLIGVSSPDPNRSHDEIDIASRIVTSFPKLYPHLIERC